MADELTSPELLYFNGVNGATGDYGLPAMTGAELAKLLQGHVPAENLSELTWRRQQRSLGGHYGVKEDVDPKNLNEAGWGVIFAADTDPAIREALSPLLTLRAEQAGERFKCCEQASAYRPGESKSAFLGRFKVGPGPVDPRLLPYYLLLVGSPQTIPYRFQSQLDVQYAVGRIHFEAVEEYACYAESVVKAEKEPVMLPRKVSFFGVENALDQATRLSTRHLVNPLTEALGASRPDWQLETLRKDQTTKADLSRLLGGADTPALLFTASHGMEFPLGDVRQLPHQGALLCRDWPGPAVWRKPIPQDFYFAGDDLAQDAQLLGLIGFFFACYGGGTPELDDFSKQVFKDERQAIAPHPFLASLPTKMLSHPKGGALAVVGHVERAWGCSFTWPGAGSQTAVFESTLERLLSGHPIGSAMEYFNERYAELSTVLADHLEEIDFGAEVDPYELAGLWTANNDARGYAIIGDPAVRLRVAAEGAPAKPRPVLAIAPVPTTEQIPQDAEQPGPAEESEDLETLTVRTYAAANPEKPQNPRLLAKTQIILAGDVETYLADGDIDTGALAVHEGAVRDAVSARMGYLALRERGRKG